MPLQNTGTNGRGKPFTDSTKMSPKEEFKAEVLRVVTDMFTTILDSDMLSKDKYELLTYDTAKLFGLCMED